jgi:hypothetical protein
MSTVAPIHGTLEMPKLLSQRGFALGAWRRRTADRHRLDPDHHLPPLQQIETKAARDRDEPRQDGPLRVKPLEVDEGAHERVLGEIFGVGRAEQSPAEAVDGPVKVLHQLLEGRGVAATGAMRKLNLCPPIVCIRGRGRSMVGVDAARSSPSTNKVRATPEDYFMGRTPTRRAVAIPPADSAEAGRGPDVLLPNRTGWRPMIGSE